MQAGLGVEGTEAEGLVLEADGAPGGASGMNDGGCGDGSEQDAQGQCGQDFKEREGGTGRDRMAAFSEMVGEGEVHRKNIARKEEDWKVKSTPPIRIQA